MKAHVIFALFFVYFVTYAGDHAGSGGNGVVCQTETDLTIETLDLYEGKKLRDLSPDLGAPSLTIEKKTELILSRLRNVDQGRAHQYKKRLEKFFDRVTWVEKPLSATNDYGYVPIPSNCKIEPIVHQVLVDETPSYKIRTSLWDKLDNDHKVAMLFHEVAYQDAIELGHSDSISTRYLVAMLTSSSFKTLSKSDYRDLIFMLGLSKSSSPQKSAPYWLAKPLRLPDACPDRVYEIELQPYVHYTGKERLQFSSKNLPTGLKLSSEGLLSGKLGEKQNVEFNIKVTAGNDSAQVEIIVQKYWFSCGNGTSTDLTFATLSGEFFWAKLSKLTRIEGFYSKINGPSWLKIAADSTIYGTPENGQGFGGYFEVQNKSGRTQLYVSIFSPKENEEKKLTVSQLSEGTYPGIEDLVTNSRLYQSLKQLSSQGMQPFSIRKDTAEPSAAWYSIHRGHSIFLRNSDVVCAILVREFGEFPRFTGTAPCAPIKVLNQHGLKRPVNTKISRPNKLEKDAGFELFVSQEKNIPQNIFNHPDVIDTLSRLNSKRKYTLNQVLHDSSSQTKQNAMIEGYTLAYFYYGSTPKDLEEFGAEDTGAILLFNTVHIRMKNGKVDVVGLGKPSVVWTEDSSA